MEFLFHPKRCSPLKKRKKDHKNENRFSLREDLGPNLTL
jgi:hypothetical protein